MMNILEPVRYSHQPDQASLHLPLVDGTQVVDGALLGTGETRHTAVDALRSRRCRLVIASLVLTAVGMLPAVPAGATTALATAPQLVSGPDPLLSCGSGVDDQDAETEPSLSVNPADGANLATAWQQDWNDAIVVGYSTDAGRSWTNVVPPTTPCTRWVHRVRH